MLYSAVFLKLRAIAILHLLHIRRHEYIPTRASLMLLLISVVLPLGLINTFHFWLLTHVIVILGFFSFKKELLH